MSDEDVLAVAHPIHLWLGDATRGYEVGCRACGKTYAPALPCSIDMLIAIARAFAEDHAHCAVSDPAAT